ncbi:MAG: endonuclease VIII, partial [Dehalococcoidia bacterium]|nr:endonuclease VIII [Dehalococcoidia bacterium]
MIELPEANTLARQITDTLAGKLIASAVANSSPHKFAWYHGDPAAYAALLPGARIGQAAPCGGMVQIMAGDIRLLFTDGVALRFVPAGERRPAKHQLLVEFDDGTALAASVQMYGGLWAYREGDFHNPYFDVACEKPSPLTDEFDSDYFAGLLNTDGAASKSAKAFLATEQRVPGLGNGVLQDILWNARINPRRSMSSLSNSQLDNLFNSVKTTLRAMTELGGRDT